MTRGGAGPAGDSLSLDGGDLRGLHVNHKVVGPLALLGLCLCVGGVALLGQVGPSAPPSLGAFHAANDAIVSNRGQVAHGNTPEALALAGSFSARLDVLRPLRSRDGPDEAPRCLTWCQVEPTSVAFLVHVPLLKRYEGRARDDLLTMAWGLACAEAQRLDGDRRLAVGLRGAVLYGAVATGRTSDPLPTHAQTARAAAEEPLHPFFTSRRGAVAVGSTPASR